MVSYSADGDGHQLRDLVDAAVNSCYAGCKKENPEQSGHDAEEASRQTSGHERSHEGNSGNEPSGSEKGSGRTSSEEVNTDKKASGFPLAQWHSVQKILEKLKNGEFVLGSALSMLRFLMSNGEIPKTGPEYDEIERKLNRRLPHPMAEEIYRSRGHLESLDAVAELGW